VTNPQPTQNIRLGIVLMVAGVFMFASGEVLVKRLTADYHVVQIVWARYLFHAVLFLMIFSGTGIRRQIATTRPVLQFTRSVLLLAATGCFFTALKFLPLADAVAINFVAPLLVTAFSIPILGERVGLHRWSAILVGFIGVLVIIRPGMESMHWAAVLPLGTALCYSLYQILTRIASRTEDARTSLFWTSAVGALLTSAVVPFFWQAPDLAGWAQMAGTGLIFGFGHYLLITGFGMAPASIMAPFNYTQIIWAAAFGLIFFDQFPDAPAITGALVVIASGLYVWRRETGASATN